VAYMTPAVMLSMRYADSVVPQISYGRVLEALEAKEQILLQDPKEREVRAIFEARARALQIAIDQLPESWTEGREAVRRHLQELRDEDTPLSAIKAAEGLVANYPRNATEARIRWSREREGALAHVARPVFDVTPFAATPGEASSIKRVNFLALLFCLMVGTAGLPHILVRYNTTPSVNQTRKSVAWSVAFIALLYLTSPAIAVLVRYDVVTHLVGLPYADLPGWVASWAALDKQNPLISITDINHDGIVQLAEINISPDVFMLAVPEITGLPYVVSGLVAAGGLAAALSTADGLLLTIASAISHDIYHKILEPEASNQQRVTLSKITLLIVALVAAFVTSLRPGDILAMVGAAFSIAASSFVPALLLGIFWKRANRIGALAGMIVGLGTCLYYMIHTYPLFANALGYASNERWWGIEPISSGVFGVPAGVATIVLVSLITAPPDGESQRVIAALRRPAPLD
jgi:cation/acetate symporter